MNFQRKFRAIRLRLEALYLLSISKFLIVLVPFPRWSKLLGQFGLETLKDDAFDQRDILMAVERAVLFSSRLVPWPSKCLDKAITCQRLLNTRGISTTLYLGMKKTEDSKWTAHAWVRSGNRYVIGYEPGMNHTVVGTYSTLLSKRYLDTSRQACPKVSRYLLST